MLLIELRVKLMIKLSDALSLNFVNIDEVFTYYDYILLL